MRCHFTSFHGKIWGRIVFFPISLPWFFHQKSTTAPPNSPHLAEAPIPMWRFIEFYCLWGQLIQQQTFGAKKQGTKKWKNPWIHRPKPGDFEDVSPINGEILTENGRKRFRSWWVGFLWSAKSLNSLRSATSKAFCTITVPPLEKAKAEAASDLEVSPNKVSFKPNKAQLDQLSGAANYRGFTSSNWSSPSGKLRETTQHLPTF